MAKSSKKPITQKSFTETDLVQAFTVLEINTLLKLNKAIAFTKDKVELLKVINDEVKSIIPFYGPGLFIVNEKENYHYDLTVVHPEMNNDVINNILSATTEERILHKGSGIEEIMRYDKARLWHWKHDLMDKGFRHPYFPIVLQYKAFYAMASPLKVRGKTIGFFSVSSTEDIYTEKQLPFFAAVTDILAFAVANIIANEELQQENRTKTILLNISEHIASINNRKELFAIIINEIQAIIPIDDTGILVLNKAGTKWQDWTNIDNYQKTEGVANLNRDGFTDYIEIDGLMKLAFTQTGILTVDEYINEGHPFAPYMVQYGLKEFLFTPLISQGKTIGSLFFDSKKYGTYSPKVFPIFRSIANMIASAVANIIANEEIQTKANEIATLNKQLLAQNIYLIAEVEQVYNFDEMIGQNPKFSEVCKNIGLVANTDSTVLILGETGTGKELVARAIHNNSPRKNKPLIKLNCAALPANLIESELFGHERGAFTGAFEKRIGKFELANGSTLFLDEVGELPLELQAKLLRALQEKEIERLGSNKTIKVDVRIIAATNRELEKEVQSGRFRQDLYYRLHIFPIILPPLKERKEDIPLLAAHFLERYTKKIGKKIVGFSTKAMQDMMSYNWPGNIRELEHVIERCVILGNNKLIQEMNLPEVGKRKTTKSAYDFLIKTWEEQERDYILEILKITNGKVKGIGSASELLQLPATTLQSKMDKLGIKRQHFTMKKADDL